LLQDGDITWSDIVSGSYGVNTRSSIETLTGMSQGEIIELNTLASQADGALTEANNTLNTKQTALTAAQTHLETL
jgi:hypothetical protein